MGLFRKRQKDKKLYLITWSYGSNHTTHFTDYILAKDRHDAWCKHKEDHPLATYCIRMKEVNRV